AFCVTFASSRLGARSEYTCIHHLAQSRQDAKHHGLWSKPDSAETTHPFRTFTSEILFSMKILRISLAALALILFAAGAAQAQASKMTTATVHIYGNCGMCENTIETADYKNGQASAD